MYVNRVTGHELAGLSLYKCSRLNNGAPPAPTEQERLAAFRMVTAQPVEANGVFDFSIPGRMHRASKPIAKENL